MRNDGGFRLIQTRLERPQSQNGDILAVIRRQSCGSLATNGRQTPCSRQGVRLTTCVGQDSRTWCALANLASRARLAATAMTAVDLRMRCTLSHPWRQASRWTIKPTLEATDSIKLGHWTLYCHSVPKWQLQGDCRYLRYPPLLPAHLPTSSFPHDSLPALATGNLHRVFRRHHH